LVRFEYRHFPFIGPESIQAAAAVECANEQGQFWQFHDTIFANQRGENQGAFHEVALKAFAAELDLDEAEFESCLDSERYDSIVQADLQEARERGVGSTPTVFINGQIVEGLATFERYQSLIEAELAALQTP